MKDDDFSHLRLDRLVPSAGEAPRLLRRRRGLGLLGWGLILLGYGAPATAFAVTAVIVPESQGHYPTESLLYRLGWIALATGPLAALLGLFLTLMGVLARVWTRRAARQAEGGGASFVAREAARSRTYPMALGRAAVLLVGLGFAAAGSIIAVLFIAFPQRVTREGWIMGTGEMAISWTLAVALFMAAWWMRLPRGPIRFSHSSFGKVEADSYHRRPTGVAPAAGEARAQEEIQRRE